MLDAFEVNTIRSSIISLKKIQERLLHIARIDQYGETKDVLELTKLIRNLESLIPQKVTKVN